jgi:hypothetical protein
VVEHAEERNYSGLRREEEGNHDDDGLMIQQADDSTVAPTSAVEKS